MTVTLKGKLYDTYKAPDFIDKESGKTSEGKHKLQLLIPTIQSNGAVKTEMMDISIPEEQIEKYKTQIGKDIELPCAVVSQSKVSFYVPKT